MDAERRDAERALRAGDLDAARRLEAHLRRDPRFTWLADDRHPAQGLPARTKFGSIEITTELEPPRMWRLSWWKTEARDGAVAIVLPPPLHGSTTEESVALANHILACLECDQSPGPPREGQVVPEAWREPLPRPEPNYPGYDPRDDDPARYYGPYTY